MINLSKSEFLNLAGHFFKAWNMLNNNKTYEIMPPVYFVERGKPFLQIEDSGQVGFMKGMKFDNSIHLNHLDDRVELVAKVSGYIVKNAQTEIQILEPFILNDDKSEGAFAFLPVVYGKDNLVHEFFKVLNSSNQELIPDDIVKVHSDYIRDILKVAKLQTLVVQRGTLVKPAKKGKIKWFFDHTEVPSRVDAQQNVDYNSLTCYHEITKGDLIAELILPVDGKAGLDIFGEVILAGRAEEISLEVGNNIAEENSEINGRGVIKYIAKESGALTLKYGSISVDKELLIHGDVSVKSESVVVNGDINIVIDGDVNSGYEVATGGNVTVKGSLNPSSKVACGKNLIIKHGLFGKKTVVTCEGDAEIGFIQDSGIVVKGELLVNKYVYNSDVYCGRNITVAGSGHHEQKRGVVIGGMLNSFESIKIHSAGSGAVFTNVQCGVNMLKKESLDKMSFVYRTVLKKIIEIETSIGFNLQDDNIVDIIKSYSADKRKNLKESLDFLKKLKLKQRQISEKIEEFKCLVYYDDMEELSIKVDSFVLPVTIMKIGKYIKKVEAKQLGSLFKLRDGKIEVS